MNNHIINLLPIKLIKNEVKISFSNTPKEGYTRINKKDLPRNYPSAQLISTNEFYYWTEAGQKNDIQITIDLTNNKNFSKNYLTRRIFNYFYSKNIISNRNFINDCEVYIEEKANFQDEYRKYSCFSLKIDTNFISESVSLLLSFDGFTYILKENLKASPLDQCDLGKVLYQGKIINYKRLSPEEKEDSANIFPILNLDIRKKLNIRNYPIETENKYKKYYNAISSFYNQYLRGKSIDGLIRVEEEGFFKAYKVNRTSDDSNLLVFGENKTNFIPYYGIKENGPVRPISDKQVKFVFVFHKDDKELANSLYTYLKKGYKNFPGIESFIKVRFEVDTEKSIRFSDINPFQEIKTVLEQRQLSATGSFDSKISYCALYISRVKKDESSDEQDEIYYKLKELFLKYNLTSQCIYKENIINPSFNYFLPNISIAILAKLGGVPWRLFRPIKNDLIIGIGVNKKRAMEKFIGNTICFNNDGSFIGFNAFRDNETNKLSAALREAIEVYVKENNKFDRLIIHYYKSMSREEESLIREVLDSLRLKIPFIIVTINDTKSKDYVLFDNLYDGKMPQSGTYLQIKRNEYLLCNNTRYSSFTGSKIDGFPLPIKIKLRSSANEDIDNIEVVHDLIDQVYQFSRMYWKSVRQKEKPVTIEYSEIIAKMVSHFDDKSLGEFARNSLWFL